MQGIDDARAMSQWQLAPFHLGAAIGPMGGGVLPVLFVVLMGAFGVDRATLSLAVPAYMFPYAAIQLISGGVSDLTSRRSSILFGFGSYGAVTLLAGLAPNFPVFLLAQALQGVTNAFMTPILMATLGDMLPGHRLGRTMGLFATANLAGSMVAPLIAGAFGDLNWRLAYVAVALVSWGLTLWYLVWFRRHGHLVPPRRRSSGVRANLRQIAGVLGAQVLLLASLSFLANGAMRGPVYLFAEYLADRWGTAVGAAGLILATYGLAGLVIGPFAGFVIDRVGVYPGIAGSMLGVAVSLLLMAAAPNPLLFAAANFLLGAFGIHAWAALNTLAVRVVPEHRGTASSIFGSTKFLAQGVSPAWFTPLYQSVGPRSIFVAAAVMAVALLGPLAALHGRRPSRQPAGADRLAGE